MLSEARFQAKVIMTLRQRGAIVFKIHGHALQQPGWPDLQVYHPKWTGHIELKVGKGKVSPIQQKRIDDLRRVGTNAVVLRLTTDEMMLESKATTLATLLDDLYSLQPSDIL